jgi:hypothetical protein
MIHLNFRSTDPEEIAIAQRYFAMDAVGKFKENVADLLPFRGITKVSQLAAQMRSIVQALDHNQQCPKCGNFEELSSRTQAKKFHQVMRCPCTSCLEKQQEELLVKREQAANELQERLKALIPVRAAMTVQCLELPDDVVLILLALDRAINPRLATGSFKRDDCSALAPAYVSTFIDKLRDARAIVDHPHLAKPDAYVLEDGKLYHYGNRVVYKLVPDSQIGAGEALLSLLQTKELTNNVAIRNLWLDYATADCMAYLFNQCELHGLPTDQELNEKIYSAFRVALMKYSVAQLWNLIWKIVRDAATLSTRGYSNRPKAALTLPGKLQRYLEKLERGDALPLKEWDRPDWQPAGTLGHIFAEVYSIDETTMGVDVMAIFADPITSDDTPDSKAEALQLSANRFLSAALAHDTAISALTYLADGIREGLELHDAISQVFELLPILDQPY